ncbi:MAG: hypothetical protein WC356_01030, partial [Candidatus Micrarchaeia archaeon]
MKNLLDVNKFFCFKSIYISIFIFILLTGVLISFQEASFMGIKEPNSFSSSIDNSRGIKIVSVESNGYQNDKRKTEDRSVGINIKISDLKTEISESNLEKISVSDPVVLLVNPINNSQIEFPNNIYFDVEEVFVYHYTWEGYVGGGRASEIEFSKLTIPVPDLTPGEHWLTLTLKNQFGTEKIFEYRYIFGFECLTNEDCNSYDADYCVGDLVMHDEGRCVAYACEAETTETQNCNLLDNNYCEETNIIQDIYTCEAASCVIDETNLIENCNDDLYCNGAETCEAAACVAGTPINCEANNLAGIATCLNNPDANSFTWDYFAGFTSMCNEDIDSCTLGTIDLTHECSVDDCSAECDAEHNCENTICTDLSGCVGNDWYEYSDVSNTCEDDCTCTDNECIEYTISTNDERCVECMIDEDCNEYDANYCLEDSIMHDEGVCVDYECSIETTETQNCNLLDNNYCEGANIMQDIYTCEAALCVIDETNLI